MSAGPSKSGEDDTCQVFVYETSPMTENFTSAYMPKEENMTLIDEGEAELREIKVLNPADLSIKNHYGIPSSINLMKAEAATPEEV